MGGRRRKPYQLSGGRLGDDQLAMLRAVANGTVVRDDAGGSRPGLWALYRINGVEVGMTARLLARMRLVHCPLLGPPTVSADGHALLDHFDSCRLSGSENRLKAKVAPLAKRWP